MYSGFQRNLSGFHSWIHFQFIQKYSVYCRTKLQFYNHCQILCDCTIKRLFAMLGSVCRQHQPQKITICSYLPEFKLNYKHFIPSTVYTSHTVWPCLQNNETMRTKIIFNYVLRRFTSWPEYIVFSFWEIQSVFVGACVTSLSLKGQWLRQISVSASNQAVWVTDGLWHDVWLLLSTHRPASHGRCLVKWPPLPVHPFASLEPWCAAWVQI